MNPRIFAAAIGCLFFFNGVLHAQVPQLINYQGRVLAAGSNFDGTGGFKFALVNATGSETYWRNDGSSNNGSEPTNAVSLSVAKGIYAILLGDNSLANMTPIPNSVFNNSDVRLRVWFNDGSHSSQLLSPDQRIASVGYAAIAGNVSDAAITSAKIASGAIGSPQLAPNLKLTGTTTGSFSGNGAGLTDVSARFPWQVVAGTSQQAQPNTGYLLTNNAQVTVTLLTAPNPGDVVRLSGSGAGGWKIAQNVGQSVLAKNIPGNFGGN